METTRKFRKIVIVQRDFRRVVGLFLLSIWGLVYAIVHDRSGEGIESSVIVEKAGITQRPISEVSVVKLNKTVTYKINFAYNSFQVSRRVSKGVLDSLKLLVGIDSVFIFGYADPVGRRADNERLSVRRAVAVKQLLYKVLDAPIYAVGKGVETRGENEADDSYSRSRRVEVIVLLKSF